MVRIETSQEEYKKGDRIKYKILDLPGAPIRPDLPRMADVEVKFRAGSRL